MLIAGEASGDLLAAELVRELELQTANLPVPPRFFGAGGPRLAAAGVELKFDLTEHAVIGLWEVIKRYGRFRRLFDELLAEAVRRQPDVIVCVDFGGFNRRFAAAIRQHQRRRRSRFSGWSPILVQYVSPQVWASRPGRARQMAADFDLLLCLLPFERDWWAGQVPGFPVEFVGHPIVGRNPVRPSGADQATRPLVALLPGSRSGELRQHLPLIVEATRLIQQIEAVDFVMVVPDERARTFAQPFADQIPNCRLQTGGQADVLARATIALSKTGTITLECAVAGVPTVTFYQTSWLTYAVGRRLVKVPYLSMPNLLAGEPVFPEFVQHDATPGRLANAALELLRDATRRAAVRARLAELVATLGGPGAPARAATAILRRLPAAG